MRDSLDETSGSCISECCLDAPSDTRAEGTQADAAATASTACTGTEAEDILGVEAPIFGLVGSDEALGLIEYGLLQISLQHADVCERLPDKCG